MASFLARALDLPNEGGGRFADTDGSVHAGAIHAIAEAGVTAGYDDGTFRPGLSVSRAQMASFLARALDLPTGDQGAFTDTGDSVHAEAIGAIAGAGVTTGYDDGTFRPSAAVTRGQMASFIARAFALR